MKEAQNVELRRAFRINKATQILFSSIFWFSVSSGILVAFACLTLAIVSVASPRAREWLTQKAYERGQAQVKAGGL